MSEKFNNECKRCTPEQMRKGAKELSHRLSAQGEAGIAYANGLLRGECRGFHDAIEIERYRRGWVNRFWFDTIGCPTFIYEALKNEPDLPQRTLAALCRYEQLNASAMGI